MNGPMSGPPPGSPPGFRPQLPPLRVRVENARFFLNFLASKKRIILGVMLVHLVTASSMIPLMDFGRILTDFFGQRTSWFWGVLGVFASGGSMLLLYIILAALLIVFSGAITLGANYASATVREFLLRTLRQEVYQSLERSNMQAVNVRGAGDYVQGIQRDVFSVDMFFDEMFNRTVPHCIFSLVSFVVLLRIDASLTLSIAALGCILFPLFFLCNRKVNVLAEQTRGVFTEVSDQLIETIGGYRDILASGRFDKFAARFAQALARSQKTGVLMAWWGQMGGVSTSILTSIFGAIPVVLVVPRLLEAQAAGDMPAVGALIGATISYVLFLQNFLTMYGTLYQFFQQSALTAPSFMALRRMLEGQPMPPAMLLQGPPPGQAGAPGPRPGGPGGPGAMGGPGGPGAMGGPGPRPGGPQGGQAMPGQAMPGPRPQPSGPLTPIQSIRFDNVTVAFGPRVLFENLSFEIPGGRMTAIVGQSGSGKTTIMNLLLRLMQPVSGMIWINDWPLPAIEERALKRLMGLIPQDPFIFNTTVRENLLMASPEGVTESELQRAVDIAQLNQFVAEKPEGLDYIAGHLGRNLSAGERQRVALARLVMQNPELIVCDEYTANVDVKIAALIHESLATQFKDRTRIVISHQLYSIKGADHILVLDQGRLVQTGSHDELVRQGGLYQDLWNIQKLA